MRHCQLSILFIFSIEILFSQQPHYVNYTTSDGLPSNEIYTSYQDKQGYIWLGTDRGVVKYDGYTFKHYGVDHGLKKLEISDILADISGRLWFSSYFGEVYYYDNDKFYPYKYNDKVKLYNKNNLVALQYIDKDGSFVFNNKKAGILIIDKDGAEKKISLQEDNDYFIAEEKGNFYLSKTDMIPGNKKEINLLYLSNNKTKSLKNRLENNSPKMELCQLGNKLVIGISNRLITIENGRITNETVRQGGAINKIKFIKDDLFVCTSDGIDIHRNWKTQGYGKLPERWFDNTNISNIGKDINNGLWVTSASDGLYYIPNMEVPVFLPGDNVTSMETYNHNLVIGTSKGKIIEITKSSISLLKETNKYSQEITIDPEKKLLYTNGYKLDLSSKKLTSTLFLPTSKDKKKNFINGDFAFVNKLLKYDKTRAAFLPKTYSETSFTRIFDILKDNSNRLWIGTDKGLWQYKDSIFLTINGDSILATQRVNSLDQLSTGELVAGTKGYGIFINHGEKNINLKISNGLTSDLINYIWVDHNDVIWAATNYGVNKITKSTSGYNIRQIHTTDGLPSEEVNKIIMHDDHLYFATNNGLCEWKDDQENEETFTPQISSIFINDSIRYEIGTFRYNENNILLKFINFDYFQNTNVKYRYRLGNNNWQYLPRNELKFSSLNPDNYTLEIQAQNKAGQWSDSLSTKFKIENIFYKKTWFLLLLALLVSALAYYFHIKKVADAIASEAINSKMRDLEKKAAIAQFNPHFIFNATSTIQYYIATKDFKQAESYLTDFTHVLRKNIENASSSFCLLSQEIDLIKKYVALEQKRFDDKFSFIINLEESIDTLTTKVPSMIFFALCDNAINTRLMHRSDCKGSLILSATLQNNSLLIEVLDNGEATQNIDDLDDQYESLLNRIEYYKSNPQFSITYESQQVVKNDDDKWHRQSLIINTLKRVAEI